MGCWNGTCGLTNLPIHYNEEVYVFPILEDKDHDSMCYSTALYRPSLLSFEGKYNDYGAVDECHGVFLEPMLAYIKKSLVEMEVGKNPYHDIAVKKDNFDIDLFFEAIHEQRLKVSTWSQKESYVYFTMVRKDAVDYLWNNWRFDIWTGKGAGSNPDDYYERNVTYEVLSSYIPDLIEKIANNDSIIFSFDRVDDNILAQFFRKESYRYWDIMMFSTHVQDLIEDGKKEEAALWMRQYLVGSLVDRMMEHVRQVWLPVTHQGSQSNCHEEYQLLNQVREHVIEDYKKQNDYDDDSNGGDDLFSIKGIYLTNRGVMQD